MNELLLKPLFWSQKTMNQGLLLKYKITIIVIVSFYV